MLPKKPQQSCRPLNLYENQTNLENATDVVFLFLITLILRADPIPLGSQYWWGGGRFHEG